MNPADFPESNCIFSYPKDEVNVGELGAFAQEIIGGPFDGTVQIVVAWQPTLEEIEEIKSGKPVFIACLGHLPPHYVCTDFGTAVRAGEPR